MFTNMATDDKNPSRFETTLFEESNLATVHNAKKIVTDPTLLPASLITSKIPG